MSLVIADRSLKQLCKEYKKQKKSHVVHIEASDNSPKEFRCVGYLRGLARLAKKYNVYILKLYSVPQHGKDKCDSEGSVIKGAVRHGIAAEKIEYSTRKTYSSAVRKFLKKHFKKMNSEKVNRTFHELSPTEVTHNKSTYKSLKSFKQYNAFLFDPSTDKECKYGKNRGKRGLKLIVRNSEVEYIKKKAPHHFGPLKSVFAI